MPSCGFSYGRHDYRDGMGTEKRGRTASGRERHEYESPYISMPAWPWVTAGVVLAVVFVVVVLVARSCA